MSANIPPGKWGGIAVGSGSTAVEQPILTERKGPVNILIYPVPICPECGYQLRITNIDEIRVKFEHTHNGSCSNDNTFFIRTKAEFIKTL